MVFQTVIGGYRSLELVSWANGTPEQLAAMLDAHYAGRINIANYWSVGDTRTVTLSAIDANNVTAAMSAQTVQLVLMNVGGKTLVSALNGVSTCAFVVGFKNCLNTAGKFNTSTSSNYSSSAIRQFLNSQLYIALPSDLRSLFKYFVNKTIDWGNPTPYETEDLLVLPAQMEVAGEASWTLAQNEGTQLAYYTTQANRIKTLNGAAFPYWVRTAAGYNRNTAVRASGEIGADTYDPTTSELGIAPFGVI